MGKKLFLPERKDGVLCLRRGFEISRGERIIIIEDVITTAKSVFETVKVVDKYGGNIVGYGCIIDRSQGKTGLDIISVAKMDPEIFSPDNCPLCKQGIPSVKPGSRSLNAG